MTVYNELNKIAYIGDTAQTLYPIPFEYISTEDIKVSIYTSGNEFVENWMYSTQYVIEDKNIKILSGYEIDNTKKILILRKVDLVQDNKYREGGDFPAKSTETSFDKLTMITQQLQETLDRCVKVEVLDIQSPDELLQSVYDKLDSATTVAQEAIAAADEATIAAEKATTAVEATQKQLIQTQEYVTESKQDIANTVEAGKTEVNNAVTVAKAEVKTTVDEATLSISDAITQATEDVKQQALDAANEAINDAAATATGIVVDYSNNEIKPLLNEIASNAAESAENASESAGLAANESGNAAISATDSQHYAEDSRIWAEGSDSEVNNVDGEHSSKVWSEMAKTSATSAASSAELAKQYGNGKINQTHITNCITEIPQDIKLELNNGTLTLKAGSKVYIPNGAGKFDIVMISSDISLSQGWGTSEVMLLSVFDSSTLQVMSKSRCVSGSTDPLSSQDHWWYNTTNNTIRFINSDGTARQNAVSLPIAIITMAGDGSKVNSINQVFNGFGYIGSTVFALPNVKGLIPNGRNEDGSLKNIEYTLNNVVTSTLSWSSVNVSGNVFLQNDGSLLFRNKVTTVIGDTPSSFTESKQCDWYNPSNNEWKRTADSGITWVDVLEFPIGEFTIGSAQNVITSANSKTTFHAVDYNDIQNISTATTTITYWDE